MPKKSRSCISEPSGHHKSQITQIKMVWNQEDINRLVNEVDKRAGSRIDWKSIAALFNGAYTSVQCKQKWRSWCGKTKTRVWKPHERVLLKYIARAMDPPVDWDKVKNHFFDRTGIQCSSEWSRLQRVSTTIGKKPKWDEHILHLLRNKGVRYCVKKFGGRSMDAYRRMYLRLTKN